MFIFPYCECPIKRIHFPLRLRMLFAHVQFCKFPPPHNLLTRARTAQWYSTGLRAGWSGDRVPAGAVNFSLHHRVQTESGAHPASYLMGTRGSFPGGKAAGGWSWPLTSTYFRGHECVDIYLHSPNTTSWRGAQLKKSTGTTLLLPL
jgi:hypothetical protein